MKVTNFGTEGLPLPLGGWSTGVTAISSNAIVTGGLTAQNFVQLVTANSSNSLLRPIANFAAGSNIALAAASNTITITGLGIPGAAGPAGAAGQGAELDYVQITSGVSLTATTEATAHTVITGTSQAYAAVPTLIEVFSPAFSTDASASSSAVVLLYDGATLIGRIVTFISTATTAVSMRLPFHGAYRLTPTAATHQYIVKAYTNTGTANFGAGVGGTGANLAAFLRITRV